MTRLPPRVADLGKVLGPCRVASVRLSWATKLPIKGCLPQTKSYIFYEDVSKRFMALSQGKFVVSAGRAHDHFETMRLVDASLVNASVVNSRDRGSPTSPLPDWAIFRWTL